MATDLTGEQMYVGEINNLPLFRAANLDTSLEDIESYLAVIDPGTNVRLYLLLADVDTIAMNGATQTKVKKPTVLKVRSTLVGRSIEQTNGGTLGLEQPFEPTGYFNLPVMPYEMFVRMDAFFRKVEKLHKTEAILVLTYDPTFFDSENPSDGWGVLLPDQENTAHHCNYEMSNVMAIKPPHVYIVGSVHSHPSMSAYFSSTDHNDQADWDGLHITFGWKGGSQDLDTELHIEMVIGGKQYPFNRNQVFAGFPAPVVDVAVIEEWLPKVKKSSTIYSSTGTGNGSFVGTKPGGTTALAAAGGGVRRQTRAIELPDNAPLPTQTTIVYRFTNVEESPLRCLACKSPIASHLISKRRCMTCATFFLVGTETIEDIQQLRTAAQIPYVIELDPDKAPKPIVVWTPFNADGVAINEFSQDLRTVPKA